MIGFYANFNIPRFSVKMSELLNELNSSKKEIFQMKILMALNDFDESQLKMCSIRLFLIIKFEVEEDLRLKSIIEIQRSCVASVRNAMYASRQLFIGLLKCLWHAGVVHAG